MKKGIIPLIFSFVLGGAYLAFILNRHPYPFVTRDYLILNNLVSLPDLHMPPFIVLLILAMFVNLCAVIACMPSMAVGAAVLYGAAIGVSPDIYPYVILEFLLCMIAAARMKGNGKEDTGDLADRLNAGSRDLSGESYVHHYAGSSSASTQSQSASGAGSARGSVSSRAQRAGVNTPRQVQEKSSAVYHARSIEEVQRAVEGKSPSQMNSLKIFLIIMIITGAIMAACFALTFTMNGRRNRQESEQKETQATVSKLAKALADRENNKQGSNTGGSASRNEEIPDLTGAWTQKSRTGSGSNMVARIVDDVVEVYWVMDNGSRVLYWCGSYKPPTSSDLPYNWSSTKNGVKTASSPMAAADNFLIFTYNGSELSFPVSISGLRYSIKLYKDDSYSFDD